MIDATNIPRAHAWQFMQCNSPTCRGLHLCFLDEAGTIFAQASLGPNNLATLAREIAQFLCDSPSETEH